MREQGRIFTALKIPTVLLLRKIQWLDGHVQNIFQGERNKQSEDSDLGREKNNNER